MTIENFDLKNYFDFKMLVDWLIQISPGIIVFFASYFLLTSSRHLLKSKLSKIALKTVNKFDDFFVSVLKSINWLFFVFLSLVISINFVDSNFTFLAEVNKVSIVVVALYATRVIQLSVNFFIDFYLKKDIRVVTPIKVLVDILIWAVAISIILQNLGFNLSTLVAGLGIGGIAIAFAIQNILSDIFSSISIFLDKPFEEGDLIVVGEDTGIVTKIGLKSTRLKTLHGEELVISNKELTTTRVRNYKKMQERRVVFSVGIDANTTISNIKKSKEILESIVNNQKNVYLERVSLKELGAERIFFDVVYFVKNKDYYFYINTQENIVLEIIYEFKKHKISTAELDQKIIITKV